MKLLTLIGVFFSILRIPAAQVVVTWSDHAFRPGDSVPYRRVAMENADNGGDGVTWDFSRMEVYGQAVPTVIDGYAHETPEGVGKFDHILHENGFDIFQSAGEWGYREEGYIHPQRRITVVYDDPAERMRYPLARGDRFSDQFRGAAVFQGQRLMEITGSIMVEADACGTLLLPDMSLAEVLRVKTVRTLVQSTPCGTSVTQATRFSWYARGYRYAVLHLNIFEDITDSVPQFLDSSAYLFTGEPFRKAIPDIVRDISGDQGQRFSVEVFPNPFRERIVCRMVTETPVEVTLELYDMTGRAVVAVVRHRTIPSGIHEEVLDLNGMALSPGMYYLRLRIGGSAVVRKMVRY